MPPWWFFCYLSGLANVRSAALCVLGIFIKMFYDGSLFDLPSSVCIKHSYKHYFGLRLAGALFKGDRFGNSAVDDEIQLHLHHKWLIFVQSCVFHHAFAVLLWYQGWSPCSFFWQTVYQQVGTCLDPCGDLFWTNRGDLPPSPPPDICIRTDQLNLFLPPGQVAESRCEWLLKVKKRQKKEHICWFRKSQITSSALL